MPYSFFRPVYYHTARQALRVPFAGSSLPAVAMKASEWVLYRGLDIYL